jgi:hypothetical protein
MLRAPAFIQHSATRLALAFAGDLPEQSLADLAVHYLLGMRHVLEQEGHVDDVDVVDNWNKRAGGDAQQLDGADLGLLDGLLLATELGRGKHLHRQPAARPGLQFFAGSRLPPPSDRRQAARRRP